MAHRPESVATAAGVVGVAEPELLRVPPAALSFDPPAAATVHGRHVWLVHPWALGEPPTGLPPDTLRVAIACAEWHARWPWSAARWQFVASRQRALTTICWLGDVPALRAALTGARSVQTLDDPHLGDQLRQLHDGIRLQPQPRLFAAVPRACGSFSQWWHRMQLLSPD